MFFLVLISVFVLIITALLFEAKFRNLERTVQESVSVSFVDNIDPNLIKVNFLNHFGASPILVTAVAVPRFEIITEEEFKLGYRHGVSDKRKLQFIIPGVEPFEDPDLKSPTFFSFFIRPKEIVSEWKIFVKTDCSIRWILLNLQ